MAGLLSGTAGAVDKIKVTMASQAATYASYLNAIAQGYYKQEGLDLDVIKAGGGTATPALMSGDVQISTSSASALSGILKGAELKILYTVMVRPPARPIRSGRPNPTSLSSSRSRAWPSASRPAATPSRSACV